MCLKYLADKNSILNKCEKSPSRHFIGYKIVEKNKVHGIVSPFKEIPVSTHNQQREHSLVLYTLYERDYPAGFHIYAIKEEALDMLKQLKEHWKKDIENNQTIYSVLPVYFYKKDIICEGAEYCGDEKEGMKPVIVVKEYTVKKKDTKLLKVEKQCV